MKKPFILSIFILCLKLSLLTFDTSVNAQALPIVLTIVSRMTDQPFTYIVRSFCNTCLSWCPL